jgi:ABC-2 type transport system permease protein
MTATAPPATHVDIVLSRAPRSAFAGTGGLLRLALRRDRIRIPVWAVGSALLLVAVASSWDRLYPTDADRLNLAQSLAGDPTLRSILGPIFDPLSTGGLTAWRAGTSTALVLALVVSFLVVRHSRADEAEGRMELVLGAAVGRAAPLAAAILSGAALLGLFAVVAALLLSALGLGVAGSVALASTVAAAALVFAGVASLTAQIARTSRGANGLAGLVVAVAFAVTAFGNGQDGTSPLVWATPFGWMQQTRAYADERWWLIGLSLVVAAALALAGLHVAARRDLGDGLVAQRRGRRSAPSWIAGPVALAWRLDRTYLVVWLIAVAALGALEGSMLTTSVQLVEGNPEMVAILEKIAGGPADLRDLFLVTMTGLFGLIAAGFGITTALRLRAEEEDGRAELVLSTARSRVQWLLGHGSTALVGSTLILVVGGLSLGAVFGASDGDVVGQAWRAMLASALMAPAVWLVVAIPIALVGTLPRWAAPVAWLVLVWCVLAGYFGQVLGLPDWLQQSTPFGHVPLWPAQPMSWTPLVVLALLAAAVLAAGIAGIRRRDLPR